jgi:hypothetical protein
VLIGFKWLDEGESQNYADVFPEELLQAHVHKLPIEHDVLRPNGKIYARARCLLTVSGTEVTLDYEPFPEHNGQHGILLGVTSLNYVQEDPIKFRNVRWKSIAESTSYECSVQCITKRRPPRIQDAEASASEWANAHSLDLSMAELAALLPAIGHTPPKVAVTTYSYVRNPYVVAYALKRAQGFCHDCKKPGPFISAATGEPYLEVHHKVRLADGGADDTENTIALCPNCHRKMHHAK